MADPRVSARGRRGPRARLRRRCPSARPPRACCAAVSTPRRWATRSAAAAPASSTPTTSTRRSAGAPSPPRARPGARVVLHLHNYRLVCAVGTCFTRGEDCTRCHGRNTLPGVRLNCRGGSPAESAAYAASLALWQGRIAAQADRFLVPSAFALRRLRALGAPVDERAQRAVVGAARVRGRVARRRRPARALRGAAEPREGRGRRRGRLPRRRAAARRRGRRPGRCRAARAGRRRRRALHRPRGRRRACRGCAATPPSRSFPPATPRSSRSPRSRRWRPACPVVAARSGGLAELVPEEGLHPPGDVAALAARARRLWGDEAAGNRATRHRARALRTRGVARALAEVYA